MAREGAARILERFDKAHGVAAKMPGIRIDELPTEVRTPIGETMLYAKFRDQLELLLTEESLPTALTTDAYKWGVFMRLYTDVIEECPLELAAQGINLKHVKGVTVSKLKNLPLDAGKGNIILFGTKWVIDPMKPADKGEWGVMVVIPTDPHGPRITPVPVPVDRG